MNWNVFCAVLAGVCALATIGSLAFMMTSFEYDPWPKPLVGVASTVVLAVADAALIGLAWPA